MSAPILKYFRYEHLPPHLKAVSQLFCDLAFEICSLLPDGAERAVALRKLLESKDAAVRAALDLQRSPISANKQGPVNGC